VKYANSKVDVTNETFKAFDISSRNTRTLFRPQNKCLLLL